MLSQPIKNQKSDGLSSKILEDREETLCHQLGFGDEVNEKLMANRPVKKRTDKIVKLRIIKAHWNIV